jgi:threonine aldolase
MVRNMDKMEFIDLRSDTVTMPTEEMLDAMRNAKAGDDVYGDDPTVNLLERRSAEILGKQDAVFVPSGTFGNQLAVLTHTIRGDEVIIQGENHIIMHEVGASAVIAGVQLRFLSGTSGTIDISELKRFYRSEDIHHPRTGLICMENPHSNGNIVPTKNMQEVRDFAKTVNVPVHLDGARIFNAATAMGISAKEIAACADSVMACFSKSLCAPIGSILAGSKDFIKIARKNRKLMGGGMRQAGYIAAPCLISLEKMTKRLDVDHKNAKYLAKLLEETNIFEVFNNRLDINMVFFKLKEKTGLQQLFNEKLFREYLYKNKIKISERYNNEFRFVTHYYITKDKIDYTLEVIRQFIKEHNL